MQLTFDNIAEIDEFMQYCVHLGRQFLTSTAAATPMQDTDPDAPQLTAEEVAYAAAGYPNAIPPVMLVPEAPPTAAAGSEKPKRTRRTKAEMEAARAAETPPPYDSPEGAQYVAEAHEAVEQPEPEPRGNPFAQSAATQAILEAPNQAAATLAGMAAMQTAADEPAQASRGDRVAQILAEGTLTDSLAHLKYCQQFIQKHGMPKYNESFTDGLTANIAVYTAEQCALHVAILEELV